MSSEEEFLALRRELEQLGGGLEELRSYVALHEEISFCLSRIEEFGRRLALLEKRMARERNGEPVAIRVVSGAGQPALLPKREPGEDQQMAA